MYTAVYSYTRMMYTAVYTAVFIYSAHVHWLYSSVHTHENMRIYVPLDFGMSSRMCTVASAPSGHRCGNLCRYRGMSRIYSCRSRYSNDQCCASCLHGWHGSIMAQPSGGSIILLPLAHMSTSLALHHHATVLEYCSTQVPNIIRGLGCLVAYP